MKIAIHASPGGFSDRWVDYCRDHRIDLRLVDCYASDIIRQLEGCDGLMWHWPHWDYKAAQFARQLTYSLELVGISVFPDARTCWHYDDKVGQKYLLEAIGAPLVPSVVFYDRTTARAWIERADFPKVFKLRRGAASANVFLVPSKRAARRIVRRAFGRGFPAVSRVSLLKDRFWQLRRDRDLKALVGIGKGLARLFVPTELERQTPRDRGYVYFQDFIPGNSYDIRVVVIGPRAIGIKRLVRAKDFRASGSGERLYAKDEIDIACVESAFRVSRDLGAQCMAFDYLLSDGQPLITEVSYAFVRHGFRDFPGYWDESLAWHAGPIYPEWFMIEDFIRRIEGRRGLAA
jgi:glutathione synthase/RimK-type ligase-like ATP-grasp enzyme